MRHNTFTNLVRWAGALLLAAALAGLAGCASSVVYHSFAFDARIDSPDITILDYQYGNSLQPSARARELDIKRNDIRQYVSTSGEMLRGDYLYVKWMVKNTLAIYEEKIDLKILLPRNIENNKVYFIVKKDRLFVYLITPDKRSPADMPNGPKKFNALKTITLSSNVGTLVESK